MSLRFAEEGYRVFAADIAPGNTADGAGPKSIEWINLDVTDATAVRSTFDAIAADTGIDVLVNNAGIQVHSPLEELTVDQWTSVLAVNLTGVFLCLQAAGRHMLAAGTGAIVNIASVASRGSAGRAPYATTKAGVVGLTATAGAEWASRGVRVNAVSPGYVDTGVFRQGIASGKLDAATILTRIPAGRLATPEEIADMVFYLASARASYLNGQTLQVDGGFSVDYGVPLSKP
jgi:3-oxoacyl-[acyl-carrier protein] reductase